MAEEVLEFLGQTAENCPPFGGLMVDGTVGGGGHARRLLERLGPQGQLAGFDRDPSALDKARAALGDDPRVRLIHGSYSEALDHLPPESACGVLLDLGLSTDQLDPERGFSYSHDAPLDMRFDPTLDLSAFDIVNHYPVARLREIVFQYGEEPLAPRIARGIVNARMAGPLKTTGELAQVVRAAVPERFAIKALARVFQALRLEVNEEIGHLEQGLEACWSLLKTGGVFCAISYHSIEDRRLKRFFAGKAKGCICPPRLPVCVCGKKPSAKQLTSSPLRPTPKEIRLNPSSRSAKLRAVRKIGRD